MSNTKVLCALAHIPANEPSDMLDFYFLRVLCEACHHFAAVIKQSKHYDNFSATANFCDRLKSFCTAFLFRLLSEKYLPKQRRRSFFFANLLQFVDRNRNPCFGHVSSRCLR